MRLITPFRVFTFGLLCLGMHIIGIQFPHVLSGILGFLIGTIDNATREIAKRVERLELTMAETRRITSEIRSTQAAQAEKA